jgi:hypothetical protein
VNFEACISPSAGVAAGAPRESCLRLDWTMPDRYTNPSAQFDTPDGVLPEGEANPDTFEVRVFPTYKGKAITCGQRNSYSWAVSPSRGVKPKLKQGADDDREYRTLEDLKRTGKCDAVLIVPKEGVYTISVLEWESTGDGERRTGRGGRGDIIVQDWVVIGMGDSYGSGQGNPDIPGVAKTDTVRVLKAFFVAYVLGPNAIDVVKEAAKAVTVEREPSWQFRQCNRSRASHQAQAAQTGGRR